MTFICFSTTSRSSAVILLVNLDVCSSWWLGRYKTKWCDVFRVDTVAFFLDIILGARATYIAHLAIAAAPSTLSLILSIFCPLELYNFSSWNPFWKPVCHLFTSHPPPFYSLFPPCSLCNSLQRSVLRSAPQPESASAACNLISHVSQQNSETPQRFGGEGSRPRWIPQIN